jgi:chromosomal replication initiator protein
METWERFCAALERRIGRREMEAWVEGPKLRLVQIDGTAVQLGVEGRYNLNWIRDNIFGDISAAWTETLGVPAQVDIEVDGPAAPEPTPPVAAASRKNGNYVDPDLTFENFVVGKCNEFAHAAAIAVADAPGNTYNPLFIYGDTGLGKTHLVHAIANRVAARTGGRSIFYCTAEWFLVNMVRAFETRTIHEFHGRFRDEVDVLLLDDVQFIAGRDRTQIELFHVFEVLRNAGKQIVITSDQPPRSIAKLEPRLRTRFEGGLLADVQPPDVETMMAILAAKASTRRIDIPSDVQYVLSQRVHNSVRELEGMLNRLSALQSFYNEPITMQFIAKRMSDVVPPPAPLPSPEQIISTVAEHYSLHARDITGNRRPANIAYPRQVAMYLTRRIRNLSFPEIGRAFKRDNSTVQHGVGKIEEIIKTNPNARAEIEMLERTCRGG